MQGEGSLAGFKGGIEPPQAEAVYLRFPSISGRPKSGSLAGLKGRIEPPEAKAVYLPFPSISRRPTSGLLRRGKWGLLEQRKSTCTFPASGGSSQVFLGEEKGASPSRCSLSALSQQEGKRRNKHLFSWFIFIKRDSQFGDKLSI